MLPVQPGFHRVSRWQKPQSEGNSSPPSAGVSPGLPVIIPALLPPRSSKVLASQGGLDPRWHVRIPRPTSRAHYARDV
jgi:hypothetical protein